VTEIWTISKALEWTAQYFKTQQILSPRLDAELLLSHLLGMERIHLYTHYDQPLSHAELSRYKEFIKRRIKREPVAYITGHKEFWSLDFEVTPQVLIPRPETELIVETVLKLADAEFPAKNCRILDLCTGSGNIAVSLAAERSAWQIYAADISAQAVEVAGRNACRNNINGQLKFMTGDLFAPLRDANLEGSFDFIVSNPPYIAREDMSGLPPEVRDYEPEISLDGGERGIQIIDKILTDAPLYLIPGGYLVLEIGEEQVPLLENSISNDIWGKFYFVNDYCGKTRIMVNKLKLP